MNRKQIVIALSAATLSLPAFAANAAQFGDENNLDWLPGTKASTSAAQTSVPQTTSSRFVHIGDENNLDWLPTPAKR